MSVVTIKSKCNLDTGSWTVDKTLLSHVSNEIGIGFENNSGTTVVFTNFSFYYKITDNADNSIIVDSPSTICVCVMGLLKFLEEVNFPRM